LIFTGGLAFTVVGSAMVGSTIVVVSVASGFRCFLDEDDFLDDIDCFSWLKVDRHKTVSLTMKQSQPVF
jgi:hypothetical protein